MREGEWAWKVGGSVENSHKFGKWVVLRPAVTIYRRIRIALVGRFLRIAEIKS